MNRRLSQELALIAGGLALVARRNEKWSRIFGLSAVALTAASWGRDFHFRGKSVVLTGGSRGLGLSLAWNALKRGARVVLIAREADELEKARVQLQLDYPRAKILTKVCDVTDRRQLDLVMKEIVVECNGIDLWVNDAGSILVGPFLSMQLEDFRAQMKLHLYSVIEVTRRLVPHFQTRGGGRILNICSIGGRVGVPHMSTYDASKFALAGFSQGVTAELAPLGIHVTTAYPTVMRTGSPIQAVFKGEQQKEYAWFQALDAMPGLSMSANRAAVRILDAVEEGRTEVVLSLPAKTRVLLGALMPETMNATMAAAARLLPNGRSSIRRTGAESAGLFRRRFWFVPLKRKEAKEERRYNQTSHRDAEHAMGLHT